MTADLGKFIPKTKRTNYVYVMSTAYEKFKATPDKVNIPKDNNEHINGNTMPFLHEILDQIDKFYTFDLPQNLVENELSTMTQTLKKEDIEKHKSKNEKLAKSRIKLGLVLNEYGEKNNLKVSEEEIRMEINKQVKGMPGQEKMVIDYYQKNPSAAQSLKGALYEDKILSLFKSKIKIIKKNVSSKEAEKIISDFNKSAQDLKNHSHDHDDSLEDIKKAKEEKKISKKSLDTKKKTKKVSKK